MDFSSPDSGCSGNKILFYLHILNICIPDGNVIFPKISVTEFQESPIGSAAIRISPAAPSQIRIRYFGMNTAHTAADIHTTSA